MALETSQLPQTLELSSLGLSTNVRDTYWAVGLEIISSKIFNSVIIIKINS